MAYTALYRELRPRTFKDVVGQEHITTTLKNQILNNRIAHAYLFSGTRGTGKTTCAKILSKALNCTNPDGAEPCNECENCRRIDAGLSLDVVEQDAATNNKVDDIRELIDEIQYPPQEGKYKVYILDEVHMLTIGAVNAFLKTLEEPPENTVFILATTDPQKLPITILSRCQRFDFKRIKAKDIETYLREIVDKRGIFADNKSLELISRVSEGAMRDALSILDQSISMGQGKVEYEILVNMLGLMGRNKIIKLADSILSRNVDETLTTLDFMIDGGKDPYFITRDLLEHFRNILVTRIVQQNPEELVEASSEDIEIYKNQSVMVREQEIIRTIRILQEAEEQSRRSSQGRIYLELALIKICNSELDYGLDVLRTQISNLEHKIESGIVPQVKVDEKVTVKAAPRTYTPPKKVEKIEIVEDENSSLTKEEVRSKWNEIMEALRAKREMVIKASLMGAVIKNVEKGVVTIEFPEEFSHNITRLSKNENTKKLIETMESILGTKVYIRFSLLESGEKNNSFESIIKEKQLTDIEIK